MEQENNIVEGGCGHSEQSVIYSAFAVIGALLAGVVELIITAMIA